MSVSVPCSSKKFKVCCKYEVLTNCLVSNTDQAVVLDQNPCVESERSKICMLFPLSETEDIIELSISIVFKIYSFFLHDDAFYFIK